MKPKLKLVSQQPSSAPLKRAFYISGGYDMDRRHYEFARSHNPSLGELEPTSMPLSYSQLFIRWFPVVCFAGYVLWIIVGYEI